MWSKLTRFIWSDFVLKWIEVSYGKIIGEKITMYIIVTLYRGYLIVLWLFNLDASCTVVVLTCFIMCGCVCVCVCVCVGVLVICVLVFSVFCIVCTVFLLFCLCIYVYLFLFVLSVSSVRTTATEWQLNCSNNNNNNNNNMFWFCLQILSEIFLTLRIIQRGIVINAHRSSCQLLFVLLRF
jgi:hypothetical protein